MLPVQIYAALRTKTKTFFTTQSFIRYGQINLLRQNGKYINHRLIQEDYIHLRIGAGMILGKVSLVILLNQFQVKLKTGIDGKNKIIQTSVTKEFDLYLQRAFTKNPIPIAVQKDLGGGRQMTFKFITGQPGIINYI